MKFLLLFVSVLTLAHATPTKTKFSSLSNDQELDLKLRNVDKQAGRCGLNLCFAFDGSGSINQADFDIQRYVILDTVAIIAQDSADARFAAVQYGSSIELVTPLIEFEEFSARIIEREHPRQSTSHISGGIQHCADLLYGRKGDLNGIVLLTDGRQNFGRNPAIAANRFRNEGGEMFVVSVGFSDSQNILEIAGGDATKVLDSSDFIDVLELGTRFTELTTEKCGAGA